MWWKTTPALAPALGLLIGCSAAPALWPLATPWWTLLAMLSMALWRRPSGWFLLALVFGCWHRGQQLESQQRFLQLIDTRRPLVLVARAVSHSLPAEDGWRLLVVSESLQQGAQDVAFTERLWLTVPGEAGPRLGDRLRLRGYLRRPAARANGPRASPGQWRFDLKHERLMEIEPQRGWLWRRAQGLHQTVERACERLATRHGLSHHGLAWLRALVLGDRQQVPLAEQQTLRRLGLAHLLAVSGLHLGLVIGALYGAGRCLPWRLNLMLTALGASGFASLLGLQPSISRAVLMALLTLGALLLSRPPEPRNALAVTVGLLLLQDPTWVLDVGFRLSVSATAGILWWAPGWAAFQGGLMGRLPPWLRQSLAVSLAAQLATLPWLLQLHGGVHPLALVVHLIALPWLTALLFFCLLATLLSALSVGGPCTDLTVHAIEGLAAWPTQLSELPVLGLGWIPWQPFGCMLLLWVWGGWGLVVSADGEIGAAPPRRRCIIFASLAMLALVQRGTADRLAADPELWLIDVGQGDAVLLRDGERALLVDGGGWRRGDAAARILLPVMSSLGIRRLQAVLISHGDIDHCGGARDLLRYLPVEELWTGPLATPQGCMAQALATAGPRWRPKWTGDVESLGRWRLRVLHPGPGEPQQGNESSVVLQATVHGRRILLTGDIEGRSEGRLLAGQVDAVEGQILKVAHHGSKTSTGAAFVQRVAPRLALVSAGVDNTYGHPAPSVIERLRGSGAVVLRTDLSGMVQLRFPAGGPLRIELPGSPRSELPSR